MTVKSKKPVKDEGRVNKSKAIRDYKRLHKKAKPKQIAEALNAQGIDVDAQYVSMVLSQWRKKKKGKLAPHKEGNGIQSALRVPQDGFAIEELRLAKQLVEKSGGIRRALRVISAYKQLV